MIIVLKKYIIMKRYSLFLFLSSFLSITTKPNNVFAFIITSSLCNSNHNNNYCRSSSNVHRYDNNIEYKRWMKGSIITNKYHYHNNNYMIRSWIFITSLSSSSDNNNDSTDNNNNHVNVDDHSDQHQLRQRRQRQRIQISGVSVSSNGFYIMLQIMKQYNNNNNTASSLSSYYYIPIQVTQQQQQQQQQQGIMIDKKLSTSINNNSNKETTTSILIPSSSPSIIENIDNDYSTTTTTTDGNNNGVIVSAWSSPEALTILQLLSNVDMAGVILPPEILSRILILYIEYNNQQNKNKHDEDNENVNDIDESSSAASNNVLSDQILLSIRKQLKNIQQKYQQKQQKSNSDRQDDEEGQNKIDNKNDYLDNYLDIPTGNQGNWLRSKIQLPIVTLDDITIVLLKQENDNNNNNNMIIEYHLSCYVHNINNNEKNSNKMKIILSTANDNSISNEILKDVCYQYESNGISTSFISLALALRYKVPIYFVNEYDKEDPNNNNNNKYFYDTIEQLILQFPLYQTISNLQQRSTTVEKNIKRGFEYQQLQNLYNIAIEKNDIIAAYRIQSKMDDIAQQNIKDNIPVQSDTDYSQMQ